MTRSHSLGLLVALVAALPLQAQVPQPSMPSMEFLEEMRETSQRMMNPAAMALEHRTELRLSESQIAVLEPASAELQESIDRVAGRTQDVHRRLQPSMMDPQAPLNEDAIREAYRQKAELDAELMIQMLRSRRLVAQTLDSTQQAKLMQLQSAAAMEMLQRVSGVRRQ